MHFEVGGYAKDMQGQRLLAVCEWPKAMITLMSRINSRMVQQLTDSLA